MKYLKSTIRHWVKEGIRILHIAVKTQFSCAQLYEAVPLIYLSLQKINLKNFDSRM